MDEGLAIDVMGKRESYEDEAERVMSLVAGADVMLSSMTVSRNRGGLLHRLETEEIRIKGFAVKASADRNW